MNRLMTGFKTRLPAVAVLAGAVIVAAACGDTSTQSHASSYLVIENLTATQGAQTGTPSNTLASDVVTNGTVYEDIGQVNLKFAMKNPGTTNSPTTPSPANEITVNRYRVVYTRPDGRNTQGVDVPYAFDGAITGTVTENGSTLNFVLVRVQAKLEPPLRALVGSSGVISTIAQVTFYGRDQAGNETSVTGSISVNFADWGDPLSSGTAPTADFVFSPAAPIVGQDVFFNASSSTPGTGRTIVSYEWDFGWGVGSAGVITRVAYPVAGDYMVTLVVTDDLGQKGAKSQQVTVK